MSLTIPRFSWTKAFVASNVVIPTLLATLQQWSLPPYVPRQLIHDNNLLPLIFAPWAGPSDLLCTISRLLQVAALATLPLTPASFLQDAYSMWILIALARALEGWILTRCVGWAAPRFFKHWSLYEASSGFGPVLFAGAILQTTSTFNSIPQGQGAPRLLTRFRSRKYGHLPLAMAFGALLCWLENAPWTYGVALLAAMALVLVHRIVGFLFPHLTTSKAVHDARSRFDTEMALLGEPTPYEPSRTPGLGLRKAILLAIVSLVTMQAPYALLPRLISIPPTAMPVSPTPTAPLLEILMLTYPRSDANADTAIMHTTLDSYIPLLDNNTRMSVFTHAKGHIAFDTLQKSFSSRITFYADDDTHSDAWDGHYLHLAEAFRWVSGPRTSLPQAEWVMLIEDDFPICAGEVGKNALRQVLSILDASRPYPSSHNPDRLPFRRGGFIGTGGSGLIIHKTMLPVLQVVLRVHAERQSKLPEGLPRRPPDVVLQDCLLGKDPMCPIPQGDVCLDQNSKPSTCGLVITSQLVMDHIGGLYSTTRGKTPNSDKWRCGWRHPFHGSQGLEVVVADL